MNGDALLYLYGVVPPDAPEPPAELRGLEDGRVRLVAAGGLAGVVSEVPARDYDEETLDRMLSDVQWVGERGVAHERVLTWFVDRGPVVPFTLFSLHRDEDRVRERIGQRESSLQQSLARVRGRREWGIKLWRNEELFAARLDSDSPALRELTAEMEGASAGRRFLLARKRDALRTDEARRVSHEAARSVFRALANVAEARALDLPPALGGRSSRTLVLHAAFLVADDSYELFEQRVQELAAQYSAAGFDWEFTGPWPPYHFTAD